MHMCNNRQLVHFAWLGNLLIYSLVDFIEETLSFGGYTCIVQASIPNPCVQVNGCLYIIEVLQRN